VLDIDEMSQAEIHELLYKVGDSHRGFIPSVMPYRVYTSLFELIRRSIPHLSPPLGKGRR
jgi:hypothetical protein